MSDLDIEREDLVYAKYQALEAEDRLGKVKERAYLSDEEMDPEDMSASDLNQFILEFNAANLILDLQLSVELAVKSMFIAVGVEYPQTHQISFEDNRTQGLISNIPDEIAEEWNVPRTIFLTQFWHQFYELSKYGVPSMNITPTDLVTQQDSKKAIQDAEFCVGLATDLIEHQEEELDVEIDVTEFWT